MNRRVLTLLMAAAIGTGVVCAQQPATDGAGRDTAGLGERTTRIEKELEKLKALKISGYVQTEWQHFSQNTDVGRRALYSDSRRHFFTIRRGRIKFQHRLNEFMTAVLQPDITETGVRIKDAYAQFTPLAGTDFSITAGMFNRPNQEVELSSSTRESAERAQVVRAFYPDERDLGVMFSTRHELFPLFAPRLQAGVFNGVGTGPEIDPYKDIIARLTFPLPFDKTSPVQADLGASIYYGGIPQTGDSIVMTVDGRKSTVANDETGSLRGWGNKRNVNVEAQISMKLFPFGSTILRGEFLTGERPTAAVAGRAADSVTFTPAVIGRPLQIRNQMGYYAYFIQNIGSLLQIAAKYDFYDRNTGMSGTQVTSFDDAAYGVLGVGANLFFDNTRITLWHEIPTVAASENGPQDIKDDKTTVRFQYRF